MKGMKLGQRWSRLRKPPGQISSSPHGQEKTSEKESFSESLPDHLDPAKVRMLLRGQVVSSEQHQLSHALGRFDELEHLIERAVYHKATLKQLKERVGKEKDNPWFESNLDHSFEHWNYYLKTLEMIADARKSLQSLKMPEKRAVEEARKSTHAIARHPVPLE